MPLSRKEQIHTLQQAIQCLWRPADGLLFYTQYHNPSVGTAGR